MSKIDKLKDQINIKHEKRDAIRKKYLVMGIEEAGNKL